MVVGGGGGGGGGGVCEVRGGGGEGCVPYTSLSVAYSCTV